MKTYPLFRVHVPAEQALANIREVFDSGYVNEGAQVTALTRELGLYLGADNIALTNSCTSAITMALRLSGVGPVDDVVSTPMTCVATNTPILNLSANVVWADVDPAHGMIDPGSVAQRLTPKTKAVVAVAWAGTAPELAALKQLCTSRGVKLVLDAAHAFAAEYRGKPIHEWAHFTTYSFQAIKHFTTGDGGALVCADKSDHDRAKAMKWFGLDRDRAKDAKGDWKGQQWDVDIAEAGFKFNMNNVAAAIGLSQVDHASSTIASHRANAALYDELLSDSVAIRPCTRPIGSVPGSSFWVYTVKVDPRASKLSRNELLRALNAEGVMAGVVHVPNDEYSAFKSSKADLPGVREFSANQLSLPCGWWMEAADVEHVAARVKELSQ